MHVQPVNGEFRGGGSSWQSLARGTRSIESRLPQRRDRRCSAAMHGVPTPANALMQRVANEQARIGAPPEIGSGRYAARRSCGEDPPVELRAMPSSASAIA